MQGTSLMHPYVLASIIKKGEAVEAHEIVRCRGAHIFWTVGSQMAVRLSSSFVLKTETTPRP
jgi:hypothetical protein